MAKKIEIFKPGKHRTVRGEEIEFTADQLAATVSAYDPELYQAPLVIGHPKLNAPAYGWVKSLEFAEKLLADPDQVEPAFAAMVNDGRFKRVSSSFFKPDSPDNPKPGVYYLRHVGFLGAAAPAVQGLKPAEFGAADDEGVVEFGWDDRLVARMFRGLKNLLITKFDQTEVETALPEWDLEAVTEEALRPEEPTATPSPIYAAPEGGEEIIMPTPEEIAAREADLSQREAAIAAREASGRHTENVAFAAALVTAGKLIPAQQDQVVAILDYAGSLDETTVIEFGAGEEKTSAPVAKALRTFLEGQPKIVEFGEAAPENDDTDNAVAFAAAPGYTVDQASLETHNKALAYQSKNPGTDYMTAVKAVS